jgi:hypothetical protein
MACKNTEQVSIKPALSEDTELIHKIQDILKRCTGKIIKIGDKLKFKNGTIDVVISSGISLARLQHTAKTIIEFQTLECGQLYYYPCTYNTTYGRSLALGKIQNWYDSGWISPESYEKWTITIKKNDKIELEHLNNEIHRVGKIIWSIDEIIHGSKKIGSLLIDLQARLQTGLSVLRFLISCSEDTEVALRLEIRTHIRSPTILS